MIFGTRYGFRFHCLFIFLKSIRKRTIFDLVLGSANDGAPHYELFDTPSNHSRTRHSTSFLTYLCVPLVLYMVASRLALHPLLTYILQDVFSRFQVLHQTTLWISVKKSAIHYVVSLLNVDTYFP